MKHCLHTVAAAAS